MEKSALIIIDLQAAIKKLVKSAQPNSWDTIIAKNRALIGAFDAADMPVYIVAVEPKRLFHSAAKAFGRLLLQNELDANPRLHKLIKYGPSAFTQSEYGLAEKLRSAGVRRIVVTGVSLDNGVIKTAKDGADVGFDVVVVSDASAARSIDRFEKAIEEIKRFGSVVTTADVIDEFD